MIPIEASTRRRLTGLTLPFLVTLFCWAFVLAGAGTGMNIAAMTTLQFPLPMELPKPELQWSAAHALAMAGMWWAMMLAMMLPGAIAQSIRHAPWPAERALRFFSGYALVWLLFSAIAAALQFCLEQLGWLHGATMWSTSTHLSATLLAFAGVWQFLPLKQTALARCNEPYPSGSTLMAGVGHGRHCLTATAPLMLLLFVGGAMNLYWIIGLAMLVSLEKLMQKPRLFSAIAGGACFALALRSLLG